MASKGKIIALAALAVLVSCGVLHAESLGRITGPSGAVPATIVVEQPQDALNYWQSQGVKNNTLIIISEDLPLFPIDDDTSSRAIKAMGEGRLDEFLARPYITPVYYPVNRATYVYLAAKAGMVARVYWVPPTRQSLGEDSLERIKGNFRSEGASKAELDAVTYSNGRICGSIRGVPVCVCCLKDLKVDGGDGLLAIDLSFFSSLYKDEVTTPMLDLIADFMKGLSATDVRVSQAVISMSTCTRQVPLEERFIGSYIKQFLTEPSSLDDGPPVAWSLRSEGMYCEMFYQPEEALKAYRKAVDAAPEEASYRFDLARAYFLNKDVDGMKRELDAAVGLDRGYYPAYIEYGRYFMGKELPDAAEDFASAAVKACPDDPDAWKALHDIEKALKKYPEALEAQKKYLSMGYNGPQPLYELARDYYLLKKYGPAMDNFNKALGMLPVLDTTLRPHIFMGMAQVYEANGKISEALDAYSKAFDSTVDDHLKNDIATKYKELKDKWKPFMGGGG
jgi:Tetratricopeptide repeat